MPVNVSWLDKNQSVILQTFRGYWDFEDIKNAVDITRELIDSVPHIVHVITDVTASNEPPAVLFRIARYAESKVAEKRGLTIVVGMGVFMRTMINSLRRVFPVVFEGVYLVENLEAAIAQIENFSVPAPQ